MRAAGPPMYGVIWGREIQSPARRLLRASSKGPSSRRAGKKRDKLAPFHISLWTTHRTGSNECLDRPFRRIPSCSINVLVQPTARSFAIDFFVMAITAGRVGGRQAAPIELGSRGWGHVFQASRDKSPFAYRGHRRTFGCGGGGTAAFNDRTSAARCRHRNRFEPCRQSRAESRQSHGRQAAGGRAGNNTSASARRAQFGHQDRMRAPV